MSCLSVSLGGILLSSTNEKQLQEVEQLIIHGEFQEALSVIEEGLKQKKISKEEELSFLVLKSEAILYLGNLKEALQLADRVLKESEGLDNFLIQLDALIPKSYSLFLTARYNEGIQIAEKGLKLISAVTNLPAKDIARRKARLLLWKARIIAQLGDFERNIEPAKEALSLAEESGYKNTVVNSLIVLGEVYEYLGESRKSKEFLEEALKNASELGNKFYIAFSYLFLARIKQTRREYEQAIELYKRAFALLDEIGSTLLYGLKNDMGNVYQSMYQLDEALECYQVAIKYSEWIKFITFANIGLTYFFKYELEHAQEYYLKSLKISEEIQDRRILPSVLFNLIQISIELRNLAQAKNHLERLEQINIETGFEHIGLFYRFASQSKWKH